MSFTPMSFKQRIALAAYSLGWWLVLPLAAIYLLWRGLAQPEYRRHWAERFAGRGEPAPAARPIIWVHAVSVGETRAAQPLIEALAERLPDAGFVLTHMTPTGRAVGRSITAALPGRVAQRYLPYDLSPAAARFFRETRPDVGIVMETEVWPNLLHAARRANVPVLLANARLSEKSAARGARLGALLRPAAAAFSCIAAQSEADRERLSRWYAGPIEVVGNLKFDLTPDEQLIAAGRAWREKWRNRRVLLFASTREGEEALILPALKQLGSDSNSTDSKSKELESDPNSFNSNYVVLVVPRHPQRFDEVAKLVEVSGFVVRRRSAGQWDEAPAGAVLLGDTMGEMAMYYAAADVALIGGSLLDFGAQNLIEACAVGTPVVLGPSTYNFAQASADALACGAAVQVADADAAIAAMASICSSPARRARMSTAASAFAAAHRGATARTVRLVLDLLRKRASAPAAN